ncbi:hypothetical protein GCM10012275_54090 [Longimycelium tulufanense]|uniref:Uncharacterized protein n=1 Tax=Longimycelium tulufanense TaxID=907463 RepID=A0A8J3CKF8_9PSEU|nr:hypothetical protein [Longimycelium tulufanense]GGM76524.1 hypothetical protein GCM10012275_54090 [Longimycelium tulufanense]
MEPPLHEVQPGDVVLMRSAHPTAELIRALDYDAEVDFAALALGHGLLGEVVGVGSRRHPLAAAVAHHAATVVLRPVRAGDAAPVLRQATRVLDSGARLVQHQLALLGVLTLTRPLAPTPSRRPLVQGVLSAATTALHAALHHGYRLLLPEFVPTVFRDAHAPLHLNRSENGLPGTLIAKLADTVLPAARPRPATTDEPGPAYKQAVAGIQPVVRRYLAELAGDVAADTPPPSGGIDQEDALLQAVADFAAALAPATGQPTHPHDPRLALQAVTTVVRDPHFLTPGDLLRNPALTERLRLAQPVHS